MGADTALTKLAEGMDQFGVEAFKRPSRGPALIADIVAGSDPHLYEWSRALEIACGVWAHDDQTPNFRSLVTEQAQAENVEEPLAQWAADAWYELPAVDDSRPVETVEFGHTAETFDPPLAAEKVPSESTGAVVEDRLEMAPQTQWLPVVAVLLLVCVLVVALLLI